MKKYHQSTFSGKRPRGKAQTTASLTGIGFVVVVLIGLFIYGVAKFNAPKEEVDEPLGETITEVMTPSPTTALIEKRVIDGVETATLVDVRGRGGHGEATRFMEDGIFTHAVKATLPAIDRETHFYEGWLLRRVPFDFFSTGEMVTNDDGEFVLEWKGKEGDDFSDYPEVIITLEQYDDDPAPSTHYLNGEFDH